MLAETLTRTLAVAEPRDLVKSSLQYSHRREKSSGGGHRSSNPPPFIRRRRRTRGRLLRIGLVRIWICGGRLRRHARIRHRARHVRVRSRAEDTLAPFLTGEVDRDGGDGGRAATRLGDGRHGEALRDAACGAKLARYRHRRAAGLGWGWDGRVGNSDCGDYGGVGRVRRRAGFTFG